MDHTPPRAAKKAKQETADAYLVTRGSDLGVVYISANGISRTHLPKLSLALDGERNGPEHVYIADASYGGWGDEWPSLRAHVEKLKLGENEKCDYYMDLLEEVRKASKACVGARPTRECTLLATICFE